MSRHLSTTTSPNFNSTMTSNFNRTAMNTTCPYDTPTSKIKFKTYSKPKVFNLTSQKGAFSFSRSPF